MGTHTFQWSVWACTVQERGGMSHGSEIKLRPVARGTRGAGGGRQGSGSCLHMLSVPLWEPRLGREWRGPLPRPAALHKSYGL